MLTSWEDFTSNTQLYLLELTFNDEQSRPDPHPEGAGGVGPPGLGLQAAHDDLGAIVLECTNMEPYAADIAAATGLPVFSIQTLVTWFQRSLVPKTY